MASVNKVILVGNCTRDAEVKFMPNGDAVANLSIATNKTWKGKDGSKQEKVEYHSLVMFRKLAEIAGDWLRKGMQIYVEGELQTRKWEKDGIDRYATEIIVNEMKMLGGKRDSEESTQQRQAPQNKSATGDLSDLDDDIPF